MYYVYIHTNKINGKKYCGYTSNTNDRWRCNGIAYKPPNGKENTRPFWNAILKYGWSSFESEIILKTQSKEKAIEKEISTIKELNLRNRSFGYNVAEGGDGGLIYLEHPKGMLGKSQTKYAKKLASNRLLEDNPMKYVKWDVTHPHPRGFKNHKHKEETKERIRNKLKGKTFSIERNIKISNKLKGRVFSEEHKANLSKSHIESGIAKGSKNPFAKKVKIIYSDGTVEVLGCSKDFKDKFKTSQTTFDKMIKSKEPYSLPKCITKEVRDNLSKLVGVKISYVE